MLKATLLKVLLVCAVTFFPIRAAQAQVLRLTVAVEGMACPFCAYGVEKKLKKVKGVHGIAISMKEGTATLSAREGLSIDYGQVPNAIQNAGFTPGTITVVATGTVAEDEQQHLHLQWNGQRFLLTELKDAIRERLLSLAGTGRSIKIQGIIRKQAAGGWTLTPETAAGTSP